MSIFNNKTEPDEENTYIFDLTCDNCGETEEYEIKKGITILSFVKTKDCNNCLCKLFQIEKYKQQDDEGDSYD